MKIREQQLKFLLTRRRKILRWPELITWYSLVDLSQSQRKFQDLIPRRLMNSTSALTSHDSTPTFTSGYFTVFFSSNLNRSGVFPSARISFQNSSLSRKPRDPDVSRLTQVDIRGDTRQDLGTDSLLICLSSISAWLWRLILSHWVGRSGSAKIVHDKYDLFLWSVWSLSIKFSVGTQRPFLSTFFGCFGMFWRR